MSNIWGKRDLVAANVPMTYRTDFMDLDNGIVIQYSLTEYLYLSFEEEFRGTVSRVKGKILTSSSFAEYFMNDNRR